MTVLVVEARGGSDTAAAACGALVGRRHVARCTDTDLDALLERLPLDDLDLVVVACNGDADAGHRACRSVRAATRAPLAMMTSSRREADELLAFARGCDDYITTTSSPEVIRARLEALAARTGRHDDRVVDFGDLSVDPSLRVASVHGIPVALTRTEFDLLHALVSQQRRVLSRHELLEVGWGGCPPSDHVLDVHLSRMRRKVLQAGGPRIGVPVPGVGYRVGSAPAPSQRVDARPTASPSVVRLTHLHASDVGGGRLAPQAAWA